MRIVIAPDSFKESLSAMSVATAIENGFKEVYPDAEYIKLPMADGGEGTVQSLVDASGGSIEEVVVTGPLGSKVKGFYGIMGDGETAVIEMAAASGLDLTPVIERNPFITTTYGTGELILAALEKGLKKIIIGLGGSATNDAGAGMMQALGASFKDADGDEISYGGLSLSLLESIDLSNLSPLLKDAQIQVACDVDNPLCGEHGASYVFGPQKGATPDMVETLDAALANYAAVVKKDVNKDIINYPGAGAAGGMGASLVALLDASLKPGIEIVVEASNLRDAVQGADLVITGEGRMDNQTIHGKTPVGVARCAKKFDVPVIGIAGSLTYDCGVVHDHGIDAVFSVVCGAVTLEDALKNADKNLILTARNVAATLKLSL